MHILLRGTDLNDIPKHDLFLLALMNPIGMRGGYQSLSLLTDNI